MEIRVLFVPTNWFLQALCSHALNYNLRQLLSLQHLTAIWVQKIPSVSALTSYFISILSTPATLCVIFLWPQKYYQVTVAATCTLSWIFKRKWNEHDLKWHPHLTLSLLSEHSYALLSRNSLINSIVCFGGVNNRWYTDTAINQWQHDTGQCSDRNFKTAPSYFLSVLML